MTSPSLRFPQSIVIVFSLCATSLAFAAGASSGEKITYQDHVRPLLENKCFSCHNPEKKKGDLDLTSYGALMTGGGGGAIVDPGNVDASRIITTTTKKEEPYMPPEGAPLGAKEIELLSKWVAGGVLETGSSIAKKSSKPKIDLQIAAPTGKPEGPAPKPEHVLLEPVIVTPRTTAVTAMAASPWAPLVALAGQKQILLFDTDTRQLAGILPYTEGYARSLKFSRNGSLLIMGGGRGGKSGNAIVWDVRTGRRITEAGKEFDAVMCADISPNQKLIAIASPSKKIKVYDTANGEELYVISKHTEWTLGCAFSPDGVLLATSDRNGNVMVWEAESGGEFYILGQHRSACTDLAWRADGNVLASCSTDGTIILWEMNEGKQLKSWSAHGAVQSVSFTPDGRLISSGNDGTTALWDLTGKKLAETKSQGDIVTKVVALHDGKTAVTANWRGDIKLWDLEGFKELGDLSSNPPQISQRIAIAEQRIGELNGKVDPAQDAVKKTEADAKARDEALAKTRLEAAATDARVKALPGEIKSTEDTLNQSKAIRDKLGKDRDARLAQIKAYGEKLAKVQGMEKQLAALTAEAAKSAAAKQQADQLAAEIAKQKQQLGAVPLPVADLDKAVADADAKIKAATDSLQARRTEKPKAEELAKAMPNRIKDAEAAAANAKNALAAAQAAAKAVVDELAALQKSIPALKAAQFNVGVLAEKDKLAKLESDFQDYNEALKENEEARKAAAARIDAAKKTIADSTAALPPKEALLKKLQGELAQLHQAIAPTKAAESQAAGKVTEEKKALAAKEAELAALVKTRDDGIAAAKKAADEIVKQIDVLKKQLAEAASKSSDPSKAADNAKAAIAKVESELGSATQAVTGAKTAADQKSSEAKAREADVAKANAAVDAAQKAFNETKAVSIGKPDMVAKVADAQKALDAAKTALGLVQQSFGAAKQAAQQAQTAFAAATGAHAAKEKALVQAKQASESAEKTAAPLRAKQQQLQASIDAQQKALVEKQAAPAAIEKDFGAKSQPVNAAIAQIKAALPPLEKALADAQAKSAAEQKVIDARTGEVAKAQSDLDAARKARTDAEAVIAAAQKEIPQRDTAIAEAKAEIAKLQPQLDPLRQKVKQLTDQYLAMLPK